MSTGVAFLLSSMFGTSFTAQAITANIATNILLVEPSEIVIDDRTKVINYLKKEYADTPILITIAKCESTFTQFDKNGEAIRGRVNRADVGVMQINEKYHLEKSKSMGHDIYTMEGNVEYAKYLYETQGAQPWSASSKCWRSKDLTINR